MDKCMICSQKFSENEGESVCQFSAYGGLPSPSCDHCFNANDFSIKSKSQLVLRSHFRRVCFGGTALNENNIKMSKETLRTCLRIIEDENYCDETEKYYKQLQY